MQFIFVLNNLLQFDFIKKSIFLKKKRKYMSNLYKNIIIVTFFTLFLNLSYCYSQSYESKKIENLIKKKREFNKNDKNKRAFKVLVYSGNEKSAYSALYKFRTYFKHSAKIDYDNPTWKVKTSFFINKISAERALINIKQKFPYAIVIEDSLK